MAWYKDPAYLKQINNDAFDAIHNPGTKCPYSGVYRCETCGHEVASNQGDPLPTQNHNQHDPRLGAIRWRLIVFAKHNDPPPK